MHHQAFNIAKNSIYDGCQYRLASWSINVLIKKTSATHANKFSGSGIKDKNISIKESAEELHKLIIKKFKKIKLHSPFTDNIWGANLADNQLISKFNKGIRFLLCVFGMFGKYAWVIHEIIDILK